MCILPYAGNRFYRPNQLFECNDVCISRFRANKVQFERASISYLRYVRSALHYNVSQGDFVGGAFWDMRATGGRLNNPISEQAQGPPLNPMEMGLIDPACLVYRIRSDPIGNSPEELWGAQAYVIRWPSNVEQVCSRPGPATASDPLPVHLSAVDRSTANRTFDQFSEAVAASEASDEVSPFSSKYDAVMAGKAELT
jgi:cytochrome c peroxidase